MNLKTRDGGGSDVLAGGHRFVVPAGGGDPVPQDAVGYSTFENLEGSNFNDTLTGDLAYNVIWGFDGADQISGDEGNDTLIGGAGGDRLDGGTGIDLADYSASAQGVSVNLLAGTGTGPSAASDALGDTFTFASSRRSTVENLRGSDATDTLVGDDNDNEIDPRLGTTGAAEFVDGGFGDGSAHHRLLARRCRQGNRRRVWVRSSRFRRIFSRGARKQRPDRCGRFLQHSAAECRWNHTE